MKRSDSFRKFFPGHVSVDKIIQNDESNRKRSQVSSNTQSQEFRSQSSHFHSSLNTLTSDSQVSSSNRYDDMLASGRHLELKDNIETIRKTVSALTSQFSSQQVALSSNANQLHDIRKCLSDIKAAQDAQDRTLSVMCELLFEIKNNMQEMKNSRKSSPTSEFSTSQEEHDFDPASQNVMSLDDYLVSRAKRARIASPSGSARDSARGDDDVSMSSGTSLKRLRGATVEGPPFYLPSSSPGPGGGSRADTRQHRSPLDEFASTFKRTHAELKVQSASFRRSRVVPPAVAFGGAAAAAGAVGGCDDSAGLLFDDF